VLIVLTEVDANMDKMHIAVFAGLALETFSEITIGKVQKYILEHPSSGSLVSPEEVKDTLDLLVTAGFLAVEQGDKFQSAYKRYIPVFGKTKIIN
jgi:hypothetical protein